MAYTITKNGDNTQSSVVELVVDTHAEVNSLPTTFGVGSYAIALDNSTMWMLGNDRKYHKIFSSGGGGGTDGTPIYYWTSGDSYKENDIVINDDCFYRCLNENSDLIFDPFKWKQLDSSDGSFGIVQSEADLPHTYTITDRKMYYCVDEDSFYYWDGVKWNKKATTAIDSDSIVVDENGNLTVNTTPTSEIDNLFNGG